MQTRLFILLILLWTPTFSSASTRSFAVQVDAQHLDALSEALDRGVLRRWVLPDDDTLRLDVGPDAQGEVTVQVDFLPTNEALAASLAHLPIELRPDAIVLAGQVYDHPDQTLALRLPESETPRFLVLGRDAARLARLADQILVAMSGRPWHSLPKDADYLLWEHNWSHRSGQWQKTADGYTVDPEERDDMAARAATYDALRPIERRHVVLRVPAERADDPALQRLADDLEAAAIEMIPRIPTQLTEPLEVLVETHYLAQGRHLATIGAAVLDNGRLHIVHHPEDLHLYRYELARALVLRAGADVPPWMEDGLALWLSRDWYGRPFSAWMEDLAFAGVLPSAEELLADERQGDGSTVLWPPVAAEVVERLSGSTLAAKLRPPLEAWSIDRILTRHVKRAHVPRPVESLENEALIGKKIARKAIRKGASEGSSKAEEDETQTPVLDEESPDALSATGDEPKFRRGISLAMANGLEIGYHAPGINAVFERLTGLGADSVSLMPFAYQPSPTEPGLRFLNRSPVSETDIGTVHAARRAHAHGFHVLWKPHIWIGHESWPGDIAMANEDGWQTWWEHYRRYILHHAVLAQFTGSEMLSVGVELGQTVERTRDWRHLIASVRQVYDGRLTYAGNWWNDYEKVTFWDALDFVGVDAYFPLASELDADRARLLTGARDAARQMRNVAAKAGKPLLLTEVGFAARRGAWIQPHAEGGEFTLDDQKLAYDAFLTALGRPDWLAGLYAWKVFSHERAEGGDRPDFRVLGRDAETILRAYFNHGAPQDTTQNSGATATATSPRMER